MHIVDAIMRGIKDRGCRSHWCKKDQGHGYDNTFLKHCISPIVSSMQYHIYIFLWRTNPLQKGNSLRPYNLWIQLCVWCASGYCGVFSFVTHLGLILNSNYCSNKFLIAIILNPIFNILILRCFISGGEIIDSIILTTFLFTGAFCHWPRSQITQKNELSLISAQTHTQTGCITRLFYLRSEWIASPISPYPRQIVRSQTIHPYYYHFRFSPYSIAQRDWLP